MNANSYFNNRNGLPRSRYRYNTINGTIGGPAQSSICTATTIGGHAIAPSAITWNALHRSTWLGEAFDPDSPPDFWLIEMSGIPFGVSSDLLEKPNPWRDMLFGMTSRALYSGPSPTPIWKVWDDFGIEDALMIGWWKKDVPVKTGHGDVLATVYTKEKKSLVAIASWASNEASIQLDIDWQKLGINSHTTRISMPEIASLQSAKDLHPDDRIRIPVGKGCLLLVE